jgi:hypothetical protein
VWIHEGALLFATENRCTYRYSTYKREWGGIMTKGPRIARAFSAASRPRSPERRAFADAGCSSTSSVCSGSHSAAALRYKSL